MPPYSSLLLLNQHQLTFKRRRINKKQQNLHHTPVSGLWQLPDSCAPLSGSWCHGPWGVSPWMVLGHWLAGNPSGSPRCRDSSAPSYLQHLQRLFICSALFLFSIWPHFYFSSHFGTWGHDATLGMLSDLQGAGGNKPLWLHSLLLCHHRLCTAGKYWLSPAMLWPFTSGLLWLQGSSPAGSDMPDSPHCYTMLKAYHIDYSFSCFL